MIVVIIWDCPNAKVRIQFEACEEVASDLVAYGLGGCFLDRNS